MTKKKRLTARERRLFKALAEGKTQKEAAIEAGYAHPRQAATQAIERIKEKAPDLFARHGLDDDAFIDKHLLPALNAHEKKFFAHEGRVVDEREVIAWGPRVQTNALVARMKGLIVESKEAPSTHVGIKVVIVPAEMCPKAELVPKNAANPHS